MIATLYPATVSDEQGALVASHLSDRGGRARISNRDVFAAVVHAVENRLSWQVAEPVVGISRDWLRVCFLEWTEAGLWRQLAAAADDSAAGRWAWTVATAAIRRAAVLGSRRRYRLWAQECDQARTLTPQRLVPDRLWLVAQPLMPAAANRRQGRGGRRRIDDRAAFAAVVYVLVSGCPWGQLPAEWGVSSRTACRRFVDWTEAGLWTRLVDALDADQWVRQIAAAATDRVENPIGRTDGGQLTGRPTRSGDRMLMPEVDVPSGVVSQFAGALGEALRRRRTGRGWTREDMVNALSAAGVTLSIPTLATYELGTRRITVERLAELCDVLGTRPAQVLTEVDKRIGVHGRLVLDVELLAQTRRPELAALATWAARHDATTVTLTDDALATLADLCATDVPTMIDLLGDFWHGQTT